MSKDSSVNFEMPAEMKMFAEKSMEQARQAFDSFVTATQQAVTHAESRAKTAHEGAKDVVGLAMKFSERNIAASFEFAHKLLQAKDAKEVTAIHGEYVNSQVAALTEQAKELSKHAGKLAGSATH